MYTFDEIDSISRKKVTDFLINNWGASIMVSKGKVHHMDKLPGFIIKDSKNIIGLITYNICDNECEIVSLDSLIENKGVGSKLIDMVIQKALLEKYHRVWLITTNDNTKAIRFYQRRGFDMMAFYHNSIEKSRKIKPEIPKYGNDDIPILHEIELEYKL